MHRPKFPMRSGAARFISVIALSGAVLTGASVGAHAETVLKFATTLPPTNMVTVQCFEPWIKDLNKAGSGEFQVQFIHGPTIASAVNVWDRVADGVVDIGWGGGGFGSPHERDPAKVKFDVREGYVSKEAAERLYSVVIPD